MNYSINALKTWNTHDGGGYTCNLLKDGKKVAECHDDGNGGMVQIHWVAPKTTTRTVDYGTGPYVYSCSQDEVDFYNFVDTLPPVICEFDKTPLSVNGEMYLGRLIEDVELTKMVKRWLKAGTVAIVNKKVLTWKGAATPERCRMIWAKHPSAFILNDVASLADAVAAVRATEA